MKPFEEELGYPAYMSTLAAVTLALILLSSCAASRTDASGWQDLSPQTVQKRIEMDSRLEGTSISAEYENGTATMNGQVDSLGKKIIAEEDLYEIQGVHSVINNLSVRPLPISDDEIARNLFEAIPSHCLVETEGIEVHVQDGNVILTGRSKRLHHKDVITSIATFTRGVRSVDDQIQIVPELGGTRISDLRIQKNIEGLASSLPIRIERLNIEVKYGVVTLSGTVHGSDDSRNIRRAVANVPGVVKVKNKLRVLTGLYTPLY